MSSDMLAHAYKTKEILESVLEDQRNLRRIYKCQRIARRFIHTLWTSRVVKDEKVRRAWQRRNETLIQVVGEEQGFVESMEMVVRQYRVKMSELSVLEEGMVKVREEGLGGGGCVVISFGGFGS